MWITRTVHFEEVSIKATRRWIDSDGKKRQQTKKFYQTLNPHNRNSEGNPKSRQQIIEEIKAERDEWIKSHEEQTP